MTELLGSKATAKQISAALFERAGQLLDCPPADFVFSFVAKSKPIWQAAIPSTDEPLGSSDRWTDGKAIEIEYYRPSLGLGRDFVWEIRIDASVARVQIAMGEFCADLLAHTHSVLGSRLGVLATLLEPVSRRHPSLSVILGNHQLEIAELSLHMQSGNRMEAAGDLQSLAINLSLDLKQRPDVLVGGWVLEAIGELVPVYRELAPMLATLFRLRDEAQEQEYPEGAVNYRLHRIRERDGRVIAEAKRLFKLANGGRLFCEVCGFDFEMVYGRRGLDFCEGHHTLLVSEMEPGKKTRPSDIAILCSNCHSMIHRSPLLSPAELKAEIVRTRELSCDKGVDGGHR